MIKTLDEATRLLNATQLMLLGKDNQPISDLYYALQIAVDSIKELAERREADRWIPVTERLPEEGNKAYLVTVDYGNGVISSCQRFFYNDEIGWNDDSVIAWKPLPKPYESEVENET